MKTRPARKNRAPTIPVQIRMPAPLHTTLARHVPKGWTKQRLILRILAQVVEDPSFVVEIQK